MIFLCFNCRGLASNSKKIALRGIVKKYTPYVIMLQETLASSEEIKGAICKLFPSWSFFTLDTKGWSRGLVVGWRDGRLKVLNTWGMYQAIGLEVYSTDLYSSIPILNVYGPYIDKVPFWNSLLSKSQLGHSNLLVSGDLNFSLGLSEAWGLSSQVDPLTNFFLHKLASLGLEDVDPIKPRPT